MAAGLLGTSGSDEYRKKLALMLAQQGLDSSPIQSPWQGASRMAHALLAGLEMGDMDRKQKEQLSTVQSMFTNAPGMTQPSSVETGPVSPLGRHAPTPNTPPQKIYSNDEPSPLDPPGGSDRDALIRVMHAEAAGQPVQGQQAVANVVRNRAVSGQYGGDTVAGVLAKPYAFEPTMTPQGRQRMASLDPNSPEYAQYGKAVDKAYTGDDPTGGATHFYSPQGQAVLGRPPPTWGQGQPQARIGGHDFFSPDQPRQQVAQAPAARSAVVIPPEVQQQIQRYLALPNGIGVKSAQDLYNQWAKPTDRYEQIPGGQRSTLTGEIKADPTLADYDIKTREDGAIIAVNKKNPNDMRVMKPPGAGEAIAAQKGLERKATEISEVQGKVTAELPTAEVKKNIALKAIEQVRDHPGKSMGLGLTGTVANKIPGTEAYGFKVMVDQLKGQSFLQAYEVLKGGGPIANAEGEKAMAAIARLDTAQSQKDFDDALNDYRDAINRGFAAVQVKAGQTQQQGGDAVVWERGPDGKPRRKQ